MGPYTEAIASALSDLYGRKVSGDEIRPAWPDEPDRRNGELQFIAPAPGGALGFLQISPHKSPGIMKRAAAHIEAAQGALAPAEAAHIPSPLARGEIEGLYFVIWPVLNAFSSNRFILSAQKRLLGRDILNWLSNAVTQTRKEIVPDSPAYDRAAEALSFAARYESFSPEMLEAAAVAERRFKEDSFTAFNCLQHGDLWLGNIMPSANIVSRPRFYIIDWAGANISGYPFFDLIKIGSSLGMSRESFRREFNRHCEIFDCAPEDALVYLFAALGDVRLNLENFSEEKFLEMARFMHRYIMRGVAG